MSSTLSCHILSAYGVAFGGGNSSRFNSWELANPFVYFLSRLQRFLFNTWGSRLDQPYPRTIFVDGVTDPSRGRPASCAKFAIFFFPICLASHQYCKICKNVLHHIIGQLRYVYGSGNNIGENFHTLNLSLSPIATSQLAPNTAATSSLQKSTRSCL